MAAQQYKRSVALPASIEQAFAYHDRRGALGRLIPPWEHVTIQRSDNSLEPGSEVILKTKLGPVGMRWHARHEIYEPPNRFTDIQVSGPFASWHHEHRFEPGPTAASSQMHDTVDYRLPGGAVGSFFGSGKITKMLESMFAYRHRTTHDDLQMFSDHDPSPLRIAVSGSTGLVGGSFCNVANLLGHQTVPLLRGERPASRNDQEQADVLFPWSESFVSDAFAGTDAVVHLAGKPIADKRWNAKIKQEIIDSRVVPTRTLCEQLASMPKPPKVLVCASAIGIYGDRGDERLSEDSPHGDGFLADVGEQWEAACQPAADAGIRVVNLRIGIAISPQGGALQKLLLPAKLGVNGPVADGKQWWSWVALDDVIGAIYHAIKTPDLSGPVNVVAPHAVTCGQFARDLGSVLHRPAFLPAPAPLMRLALGEMADALLIASTHVLPTKLQASGYRFRFEHLQDCLRHVLGK
ncbi:Epimerase family protein [Rosistilla carotiformis]|uniref:Epimerase family protein n=1 Tax=Rosistilla carotiformis TaxID=2528017 RepID=A0A518JTD9_9BACT|nr:TIGR01777 family oxidoreductase [Rosistilla carotiformis]QDV68804.1 Epimerase family protein [Rosistilla carotiformis]